MKIAQVAPLTEAVPPKLYGGTERVVAYLPDALVALGVRLGVLAAMLAVVFVGAEIWRRAVLRFAHETRRRNQLLHRRSDGDRREPS